jgi:hypothetical protein
LAKCQNQAVIFILFLCGGGEGGMFTLCGEKCFDEKGIFFQKYPVSWGKKNTTE